MKTFFDELKQAREASGLTLNDIADTTLINVKYLAAIEEGDTAILPQTYIRAFLREYAAAIGLDPAAIMKKYDTALAASTPVPATGAGSEEGGPSLPAGIKQSGGSGGSAFFRRRGVIVAGIVTVTAVALWNIIGKQPPPPIQEIPFQAIEKENEQHMAPVPLPESSAKPVDRPQGKVDSLLLRATMTDSVWVQMIVDAQEPREYLFRPGARASWKARERFTVTLGNAGAVQFVLNQKSIGTLGRKGQVVRNVELTHQALSTH